MGRAEGYDSDWTVDEVCTIHSIGPRAGASLMEAVLPSPDVVTIEAGEILQVCPCLSGRRLS